MKTFSTGLLLLTATFSIALASPVRRDDGSCEVTRDTYKITSQSEIETRPVKLPGGCLSAEEDGCAPRLDAGDFVNFTVVAGPPVQNPQAIIDAGVTAEVSNSSVPGPEGGEDPPTCGANVKCGVQQTSSLWNVTGTTSVECIDPKTGTVTGKAVDEVNFEVHFPLLGEGTALLANRTVVEDGYEIADFAYVYTVAKVKYESCVYPESEQKPEGKPICPTLAEDKAISVE
ncbi:MAG: hypothetical protein M1817_006279 [Caeruleum heppii]|nr:MAG: hypothetical protein M1817_006279 [Caeruleum heppii]